MTDAETLRALAPIAAERGRWPQDTIQAVDETAVKAAWQQAPPETESHQALTELLADVRKEDQ